jgi:hypothetical protein
MRKLYQRSLFLALSLLCYSTSFSQDFGDEWIDFDQTYYKIKVAQNGLYKVSYELFKNNNVDEKFLRSNSKLQLWHRGKQQTISIKANGDSLKPGDYFVFYGIKNDGEQDSLLYYPTTNLYNQYTNLFSDTTAYFLTVSENAPWLRADTLKANNYNNPSNYLIAENLLTYFNDYWLVGYEDQDPLQTFFTPGEGWITTYYVAHTETIQLKNHLETDSIIFEVYLSGRSRYQFKPTVALLGINPTDTLFFSTPPDNANVGFGGIKTRYSLPSSEISRFVRSDGTVQMFLNGSIELPNFNVNYIRVLYPQKTDRSSVQKGRFWASNSNPQPLSLDNVSPNSSFVLLNNRDSFSWIKDSVNATSVLLPELPPNSKVFQTDIFNDVQSISEVFFKEYKPTDSTYLILTHKNLLSSANTYADYRSSAFGGSYNVIVAEIGQVTDQFSYGERSPIAIRRLLNRLKSQIINSPDHLFIIGMGTQLEYSRGNRRDNSPPPAGDLVLPAGTPGGDFVYSIGLDGTEKTNTIQGISNRYPTVSTGRISVKTNQQVLNYLNKAKEHDALTSDATWRRNVVHLSGGYQSDQSLEYNIFQSKLFRSYIDGFTNIIKQPYFGANVTTYGRYITGATELIDLSAEVNKGTSLITFLGHSSRSITDITIGYVSDNLNTLGYNNQGKYPMLYLNGCVVGNTFYDPDFDESSLLLDWVLTPKKGAIIGLSNSSTGYAQYLKQNVDNTYISSFQDSVNFNKSIGEQLKIAQKRYMDVYSNGTNPDIYTASMIQTTTIQGDPAIHLFNAPKADYEPICDRVGLRSYSNQKITALSDSFELMIPVKNLGMYTKQNFSISIRRVYANNTKNMSYAPQFFPAVRELDTIRFKIKGALPEASGANTFEIIIDPDQLVPEMNKGNNNCSYTTFITGNTMICVQPPRFSIVHNQPVTFVAQSALTTKERDFLFELDTNFRFNSGFKRSFTVKAFNLPKWPDQLLLDNVTSNDSIVYYWRVKYLQPEQNEDTSFSYSSFIYIKDSPDGWSQSEYPQFFEDNARGLKMDSITGKWQFKTTSKKLEIATVGRNAPKYDVNTTLKFDGTPLIFEDKQWNENVCGFEGLYMLTINPVDLSVRWVSPEDGNLLYACDTYLSPLVTRFPNYGNQFPFEPEKVDDVLRNKINDGEIVVLMNLGKTRFPWPDYLTETMKTLYGASNSLDTLKDGYPYILVGRKGYGKIAERIPNGTNPLDETLTLDTTITSLGYAGYVSSTLIGPATEWDSFFRNYSKQPVDSIRFDIMGIDSTGKQTQVVSDVKQDNFSLKELISANQFPFLRLNAYMETKNTVAPQLLKWQVIYRGIPEGALVLNDQSTTEYASFTIQEGDTSKSLKFRFKNISNEPFKMGLVARYKITTPTRIATYYDTLKTSLDTNKTWISTFKVKTNGLVGNNTLEAFFNPSLGQREVSLDNNFYSLNFEVTRDKTQPILEVAFDGLKIMNGDIISPNPTISIAIDDENKYMIRKDTTGIKAELQRPCGQPNCPFERINLASNEVTIYPAGTNNKFELRYKPEKLPDGVYTLRVQAKDLSGNLSGVKPYTIQFEVVNEVTITNFLPYPNPFSTKMWFVYTLTGDMPDQIRIQILTITGKVVRQIFMDELGPLHIGTHRTDFIWDGTDDYGDQLANGLYIYKVSARKGGEELKHRNTVADNLFKNGYGKIYILR